MDLPTKTWEHTLLARAYEALHSPAPAHLVQNERSVCSGAHTYCARLIRANSRTFYLASALLPASKRRAVRTLYAFCRATDDLIDQAPDAAIARALLASWRSRLTSHHTAYDPIPLAWADIQARYRIPHGYETQLIEGIARDICQRRYATFAELTEYCYGVASTVGLMVMHIIEFQSEAALPYAIKLGVALQLTNILRDVGDDWQTGRLYLPLDELARFGLREADIAIGCVDDRWRAFMRYQIARTRALYAEAAPGIALLDRSGRLAIAAAARLYEAILDEIEAQDFDVFHRRAHVGFWGKVRRLPCVWWTAYAPSRPSTLAQANRR
jgi:phytoene synthase